MPLILTKELAGQWLNPGLTDDEMRTILAFEFPETEMEAWAVNTIRTRKADDSSVLNMLPAEAVPVL
jgi:hypothetical protein